MKKSMDAIVPMDYIEQFLRNFPNLTNIEIKDEYESSDRDIIDGYRWQRIVESLISFHFLLHVKNFPNEQSLNSFRTPFWIEEKRWFIAFYNRCLFTIDLSHMKLFSGTSLYSTIHFFIDLNIQYLKEEFLLTIHFDLFRLKILIFIRMIDLNQIEMLKLSSGSYYLLEDIQYHMLNLCILNFRDVICSLNLFEKEHIESVQLKPIRTLKFGCMANSTKIRYHLLY